MDKEASKKPKKDYKVRKRYLAFEIVSKNKLRDYGKIAGAIKVNAVQRLGQETSQRLGLRITNKWDPESQRGILRVNNSSVQDIMHVLKLMGSINNDEVAIKTLGMSGILKKAVHKYLKANIAS